MQPVATVIAALIAAFIGSWIGAFAALSRFRHERAFDRRLDWYERTIRAFHDLAQKLEIALTFQEENAPEDTLVHVWRDVQHAHLVFDTVTAEGELYASAAALRRTRSMVAQVQESADLTDAFDLRGVRGHSDALHSAAQRLRKAASPLAQEARS